MFCCCVSDEAGDLQGKYSNACVKPRLEVQHIFHNVISPFEFFRFCCSGYIVNFLFSFFCSRRRQLASLSLRTQTYIH